jgi:hypothetical protein
VGANDSDALIGTDKNKDTQGCAWQAKLALRFQIPSQAYMGAERPKMALKFLIALQKIISIFGVYSND